MRSLRTLGAAALFALASFAAFAAGQHDHGHEAGIGQPGDPKKVSRTVQVTMNDQMRFQPSGITVRQGETIRFVVRNSGKIKHELVLGTQQELKEHAELMQKHPEMEHDEEPNAISVQPGKTGQLIWLFTQAGAVDFACLEPGHFEAGMVGKVTVRAAAHSH
jgi:uncharacterized cupredoxin-like copper-binding protein